MTEKTDVYTFFTNSKSVWVSENFQNIILGKYTKEKSQNLSVYSSNIQDIPANTNLKDLLFLDTSTFLEQLMTLIEKQINGEDGELLNDSSANYFLVQGIDGNNYSVLVRWEPAQKLWRCGAYLQEELRLPNIRIFYPSK
jgi:hypothetical protein